jgi:DNA-binding GntR family transcriptional regulator
MVHEIPRIQLPRARDAVRDLLRESIVRGDLLPGAALEEVAVSTQLGVSRTPLREALIALEHEGLVTSSPRKGYFVVPANAELVRETYPILAALEAAAVRLAGPNLVPHVPDLRRINDQLAAAATPAKQHELDRGFHARLVSACANGRLSRLIEVEWTRARRFDGAHARGTAEREASCTQHVEVLNAIQQGNYAAAAEAVARHWVWGIEVVTKSPAPSLRS